MNPEKINDKAAMLCIRLTQTTERKKILFQIYGSVLFDVKKENQYSTHNIYENFFSPHSI